MGHELTHGFDDIGRQFDEDGNNINWWTDATAKIFKDRSQCFIKQFGSYEVNGQKINGYNTLGENIADRTGLSAAFLVSIRGQRNSVRNRNRN